ncbi:MAG: hypothetical protein J2P48_05970 [Alphaproteobacteria bacterium]|nr:hypothetical protein [Alphaproteobacteria bacterium]
MIVTNSSWYDITDRRRRTTASPPHPFGIVLVRPLMCRLLHRNEPVNELIIRIFGVFGFVYAGSPLSADGRPAQHDSDTG